MKEINPCCPGKDILDVECTLCWGDNPSCEECGGEGFLEEFRECAGCLSEFHISDIEVENDTNESN